MIKSSDSVEELLENYPTINTFLLQKGIVCVKCGKPFWGKLGDLIKGKRLNVDDLIADINRFINS
ncbi:MAG: DUF1858 domain-containing protein [candidate division Zixibacteria bacterium]|nr:DUF1858 domain-containing protein [candidate division Zixibacteria bacterium]